MYKIENNIERIVDSDQDDNWSAGLSIGLVLKFQSSVNVRILVGSFRFILIFSVLWYSCALSVFSLHNGLG